MDFFWCFKRKRQIETRGIRFPCFTVNMKIPVCLFFSIATSVKDMFVFLNVIAHSSPLETEMKPNRNRCSLLL